MKLYDQVLNEVQQRFAYEAQEVEYPEDSTVKAVTLRLSLIDLTMVDLLSEYLHLSRNSLLKDVIRDGCETVIAAYCDAHGTNHSDDARATLMAEFADRLEAARGDDQ